MTVRGESRGEPGGGPGARDPGRRPAPRPAPRLALDVGALLAVTVSMLLLLYSFPWLRIPDVHGVALPLQRLVGWVTLVLLAAAAAGGALPAGRQARTYLGATAALLAVVLASLAVNALRPTFDPLQSASESAKLVAAIATGYGVYYVLKRRRLGFERLVRLVMLSGAAAIVLAYVFLVLYWLGFRTGNEILAPTFGRALGVWPTASFLPRLAGTGAEPQQLSILFLTPLLLMVSPGRFRRWWPFAGLGVLALVLSQSKFSVLSLAAVALYVLVTYRRRRLDLFTVLLLMVPLAGAAFTALPTFRNSLRQGLGANAITVRLDNVRLLLSIIGRYPALGIGLGQYGTYRGAALFDDPSTAPGYYANNDVLSVFAEAGALAFLVMWGLVAVLLGRAVRLRRALAPPRELLVLPFLLGAVVMVANMFIGYELLHSFFWINLGALLYLLEAFDPPAAGRASA